MDTISSLINISMIDKTFNMLALIFIKIKNCYRIVISNYN